MSAHFPDFMAPSPFCWFSWTLAWIVNTLKGHVVSIEFEYLVSFKILTTTSTNNARKCTSLKSILLWNSVFHLKIMLKLLKWMDFSFRLKYRFFFIQFKQFTVTIDLFLNNLNKTKFGNVISPVSLHPALSFSQWI